MSWRSRLEVAIYRKIKPLTETRQQRALQGNAAQEVPQQQPRRSIVRSKTAALAVSFALVGGGGVLIGGFVENQAHEAELASMDAAEEEQIREEMAWNANHDVCMANAQARAAPDEGVFDVLGDPQIEQCYAEQRLQVAKINAGTEE